MTGKMKFDPSSLKMRTLEILVLSSLGYGQKQIAGKLSCSPSSVSYNLGLLKGLAEQFGSHIVFLKASHEWTQRKLLEGW